jgi:phosphatidate cytidylyltransferase
VALPAAALLLALNHAGGLAFAVPVALLGLAGVLELARMFPAHRPLAILAGVLWVGGCLTHAVLLRAEPHGAGLVVDVLLATFVGDTVAQLVGTAFGRRRLAPRISPNKSVEGLVAGIAVGTAVTWLFALAFQPWLAGTDALAIGFACALAAPAGDLLESAVKRRAGVKDSGRFFGAHGGVLDRIDAVILAAVAGYWVASAVV